MNRLAFAGCAFAALACSARTTPLADVAGEHEHAPRDELAAPPPPAAEAPREHVETVALPVAGHGDAVVLAPVGGKDRRPVLVATHGAGGTPEDACAYWGEVARGRGFVLCPRGRATSVYDPPDQRGYYYPDHHALIREVDAALEALTARFPESVDPGPVAYGGFSQGAIMGALLLRRAPARFPRAALVEGGFAEWDVPVARSYQRRGGVRVLFGCGNPGCASIAKTAVGYLRRAGLEARLVRDLRAGHSFGASLGQQVATAFDWLVADDPRWRAGAQSVERTAP